MIYPRNKNVSLHHAKIILITLAYKLIPYQIMQIIIFGSQHQETKCEGVFALFKALELHGIAPVVERNFYEYLIHTLQFSPKISGIADSTGQALTADVAISVGGDGTFLRTAHRVSGSGMPILGINTGSLGYLADVTPEQIPSAIADLLAGKLSEEKRTQLEVSACSSGGCVEVRTALNEIAILKAETASMISLHTSLDGDYLTTYPADGLIIATPTGSTAYNLSVGGPVLAPQSRSMVVSPIAAHSLSMRPIVVNDGSVIDVKVDSRTKSYRLSVDGESLIVPCHTTLRIRKSALPVRILKQQGHSFTSTLRSKLMWGINPR